MACHPLLSAPAAFVVNSCELATESSLDNGCAVRMMEYLEFLDRLQTALRPRASLEVSGELGACRRVSRTFSIAVAPDADLEPEPGFSQPWLMRSRETSDDVFGGHTAAPLAGRPLDFAVITGFRVFTQIVRELEQIEHWGHAATVVVIPGTLPANHWHASRTVHDGLGTGDVWRIVPFLEEHRPDMTCWLVDVGATGALVVTGLDPDHTGMAARAETLDRGFPRHGPAYERLVNRWLGSAEPIPPAEVLRALPLRPHSVGHVIHGDGWVDGPGGWVGVRDAPFGQLHIRLEEPIHGSHRARLTVTASGMAMLIFGLDYFDATGVPENARHRNVVIDVTHPGALLHGLDSLWFDADPARRVFELDWESSLEPGEALTSITIEPLDYAMEPTAPTPQMHIDVQRLDVQQIAWPRSGTRCAPERFPGRTMPPKRTDGKRDAVLFAWWLPATPEARYLGEYYLGLLRYHHADSKIFVGINHGSDPEWIGRLVHAGLDLEVAAVDPAVQMPSDVGGFLAALGAFARGDEAFDLVWFGHTKGASRPSFDDYSGSRHQHDRKIWSRRAEIDRHFADPTIGLFAHRYALHDPSPHVPWHGFGDLDSLERVYRETHAALGLWAWETVFVMRHEIVRRFCAAVGEEFFRLDPSTYGASPWWFEAAFPSIASMQGFEPAIELDTDGTGSPRDDILLYDDPRQTNRLAMEEVRRWRQEPFTFAPRALPRGYARDPIAAHDTLDDVLVSEPARVRDGVTKTP